MKIVLVLVCLSLIASASLYLLEPKPVPCGGETDPFNPCGLVRETLWAGK